MTGSSTAATPVKLTAVGFPRLSVEDLAGPYLLDRAHRNAQPLRDRLALVDLHDVQVVLRDLSGRGLAVPAPAA